MPKAAIPTPQLISLAASPSAPKQAEPVELRQQRVEEFLQARSLAPNSAKAYREDLARLMVWTEAAWGNITQRQITQFKNYLLQPSPTTNRPLAPASVRRILQTIKNFFGWLQRSGYIDRDPTVEIDLPHLPEPLANNLTQQQVEAILKAALETRLPERNMALLAVLSHGLRASEVGNLNYGDFDGERLVIRQAKSDSKGTVPIDLDAQMWLHQYLQWREDRGEQLTDDRPLFASHSNRNQGDRLGYSGINKIMKAIGQQVGFEFHAHQFRHTFATNLVLKGMDPYHVRTLTRHKTEHSFRRYTKAADALAAEKAFRDISGRA